MWYKIRGVKTIIKVIFLRKQKRDSERLVIRPSSSFLQACFSPRQIKQNITTKGLGPDIWSLTNGSESSCSSTVKVRSVYVCRNFVVSPSRNSLKSKWRFCIYINNLFEKFIFYLFHASTNAMVSKVLKRIFYLLA
jgi:hypothetical protein